MNYIDLFAGASGLSEGFIGSGFKPIAHIEMNKDACDTIRTRTVYHYLKEKKRTDIYYDYLSGGLSREKLYKEVDSNYLNSILNIEISEDNLDHVFNHVSESLKYFNGKNVDLIIGGPPCQAYSLIKRYKVGIEKDPRNYLYILYGKFLEKYKPKAFVFENVPGLLSAHKGEHFKALKAYFGEMGYEVYDKILDASDYGVLQARKRVIIVGWKKENDFGFPELEVIDKKWTTKDIFSDLPILEPGTNLDKAGYLNVNNDYLRQYNIKDDFDFVTQNYARPHNKNDLEIYKIVIEKWNSEKVRLKYNDLPKHLKTHKNTESFIDRFKVVDGKGIPHTVVAHISKDGHYYINPDIDQCRSISVREAARIQSFPDNFYFEGSRSSVFKQIGNAVPPLMATALAEKIKDLLWKNQS